MIFALSTGISDFTRVQVTNTISTISNTFDFFQPALRNFGAGIGAVRDVRRGDISGSIPSDIERGDSDRKITRWSSPQPQ